MPVQTGPFVPHIRPASKQSSWAFWSDTQHLLRWAFSRPTRHADGPGNSVPGPSRLRRLSIPPLAANVG
jgi:hypothetical protein